MTPAISHPGRRWRRIDFALMFAAVGLLCVSAVAEDRLDRLRGRGGVHPAGRHRGGPRGGSNVALDGGRFSRNPRIAPPPLSHDRRMQIFRAVYPRSLPQPTASPWFVARINVASSTRPPATPTAHACSPANGSQSPPAPAVTNSWCSISTGRVPRSRRWRASPWKADMESGGTRSPRGSGPWEPRNCSRWKSSVPD